MTKIGPYPAMKDSSAPWFGEVPEHWEVRRLKHVCSLQSGEGITAENIDPHGEFPVYGGNGLRGFTSAFTHVGEFPLIGRQGALCGNVHLASGRFWASEHAVVASPVRECSSKWLAYALRVMDLRQYSLAAAQPGLAVERIVTLPICLPPLPEQFGIVRFLDHADRRIRRYIRAKQKLIKLLEEQKQAIIHRAVTRGLDPNVRLKPSGVEWLGDVPEHWEVWQIGHFARVGNGSTPSRGNTSYWTDGTYPWLNSSSVNAGTVTTSDQYVTDVALRECHLPRVPAGSVLVAITGQGKTRGKAAVLSIEATINQHIAFITLRKPGEIVTAEYLQRFLVAAYAELRRMSDDSGSTKGALTCEDLRHFRVVLPPLPAQKKSLQSIDDDLTEVERALRVAESEIDLLREYRTRLIADVVTGKLDVREAAARLPQEAEEPETLDEAEVEGDAQEGVAGDGDAVPEEAEA